MHKSIQRRVILQVTGLIAAAMFFITLMVAVLVYKHMSGQMYTLLKNNAVAIQQRLEQRITYLAENSILLTKNEFIVNSLLNGDGREEYLPLLVKNFMQGKGVVSLSILDFDGRAIYLTQENIPKYESSAELRTSLALGQVTVYLQEENNQMVLIAPISYYATTQGSIVVVFDMNDIANQNLPNDESVYMRLLENNKAVFTHNFSSKELFKSYTLEPSDKTPYLEKLGITLELGVPKFVYMSPLINALLRLIAIGVLFILAGILVSMLLAESITKPILELYRRVKESDTTKSVQCSPIGTDDEIEALAEAFDERSLMLQYQAKHDTLTDLPNRVFFLDRLEQSIKFAQREKSMIAVLSIDLDHFKEVNDSFGHTVGDELLKNLALIFSGIIREADTVARQGGDEFTILLEYVSHENEVIDILQKIKKSFEQVQLIQNYQFYISCSIGVALYPTNGTTAEELLKNADAAVYKAKAEGRNNYQFYTKDMTDKAYERVTLETNLRNAIVNHEFVVYYQPQVDIRTQKIIGMEALIRWQHPENGMIPPDRFIPLAEDTGLIVEIDRWVMKTSMMQFAEWLKEGFHPGVLSLNMSLLQLSQKDFLNVLSNMLIETGLNREFLSLEVTETQIMKNPEKSIKKLQKIKELGITLSIDDFGTGHSSLSYLKRLPVDKLKIDQSFVRDIPTDHDDMELTHAIIAMATSLKIDVIAEGVETQEQADFLLEHGCFEAQGYFYHRPMPADKIKKIL